MRYEGGCADAPSYLRAVLPDRFGVELRFRFEQEGKDVAVGFWVVRTLALAGIGLVRAA
ncbi:MAG: hypothetical protein ACP5E5_08390 [Acidobacteriaceae bacterium]